MWKRDDLKRRLSAGFVHGIGSQIGWTTAAGVLLVLGWGIAWFISRDPAEPREMSRLDWVVITLGTATALMVLLCASVLILPRVVALWRGDRGSGVSDLRRQVEDLSARVDRYCAPRRLTEDQARLMEEFLLKRAAHELKVVFQEGNTEANQYAAQLYNVFRLGGWRVTLEGATPDQKMIEGLRLNVVGPSDHGEGKTARDTIQRALSEIGVELNGSGWSSSSDVISCSLLVGRKRRT